MDPDDLESFLEAKGVGAKDEGEMETRCEDENKGRDESSELSTERWE